MNVSIAHGWLAPRGVRAVDVVRGFYVAESRYQTLEGETIENGLYVQGWSRREGASLLRFVGSLIDKKKMAALIKNDDIRSHYCLQHEDDSYLSCYDAMRRGECWASLINSPRDLQEDMTQRDPAYQGARADRVEPNAELRGDYEWDEVGNLVYYLEAVALREILPGEEILMYYCGGRAGQRGLYAGL